LEKPFLRGRWSPYNPVPPTQEPLLFNGSIEYNITVGTKRFDPHQVREALHTACLTSDIDTLPKGVDTVIGALDAKVHLSFGQKQVNLVAREWNGAAHR